MSNPSTPPISPTVTLVDHTADPEYKIGYMASICYNSSTDRDACLRRAVKCRDEGHLATLRFAHATFHIEGISRVCSHQLVRSKHLDFLQRSQRYCDETESQQVELSDLYRSEAVNELFRKAFEQSKETYAALRKAGVKKEDARFVLPEATTTSLLVVGNFQAWNDFLNLRDTRYAQWEIRDVAKKIRAGLNTIAPNVFPLTGE